MAPEVAERFELVGHPQLGTIERQLLLEAAPAGSVPGTIILPPLLPRDEGALDEPSIATGESTRRAVRRLARLRLIEVTEPALRISKRVVEDTVARLLQAQRRSSWPAGFPETEDAAARFLRIALKPGGLRLAEEVIRFRALGLQLYLAGNDPRHFVARTRELRTAALKQTRPYLRLRNMRRTELGNEMVWRYGDRLESALSAEPTKVLNCQSD